MKTFKEFLEERADHVRAEEAAKASKRDRWITSVNALISQAEKWLKEAGAKNILTIQKRLVERNEETLGIYNIPSMFVWMGARLVALEPVACEVRGPLTTPRTGIWSGRADFTGSPYSYKVYRFLGQDQTEEWYIFDDKDYRLRPFTRENFDAVMLDLFA